MSVYFPKVFGYLIIMFIFIAIGFVLRAAKVLRSEASESISKLIVWVFLPLYTFRMLSRYFVTSVIEASLSVFVAGILALAIMFLVSLILSRIYTRNKNEEGIYIYSFSAPDFCYLGYAVIGGIFGESVLYNSMIFSLGITVFIGSVGIYLITPRNKTSFSAIVNPVIIATLLGMIFGMCKIPIHPVVNSVIDKANCVLMPLSMLVTGMVIAENSFVKTFLNHKVFTASLIRLILIPLILYGILKLAGVSENIILCAVAIMGMPMGVNTIIFPRAYGHGAGLGVGLAIVSAVLSLFSLPFIFNIL